MQKLTQEELELVSGGTFSLKKLILNQLSAETAPIINTTISDTRSVNNLVLEPILARPLKPIQISGGGFGCLALV